MVDDVVKNTFTKEIEDAKIEVSYFVDSGFFKSNFTLSKSNSSYSDDFVLKLESGAVNPSHIVYLILKGIRFDYKFLDIFPTFEAFLEEKIKDMKQMLSYSRYSDGEQEIYQKLLESEYNELSNISNTLRNILSPDFISSIDCAEALE